MVKLEDCIEITSSEYISLSNPIFIGKTSVDEDGSFWMIFENEGVKYKLLIYL